MVNICDLPSDLLGIVMIMLATSIDGAADLVRSSATCKRFKDCAKESIDLKIVNFQKVPTDNYRAHHHPKDLLVRCARVGNPDAMSMLAKALLNRDTWFWNMIRENDEVLLSQDPWSTEALRHEKLVRTFIRHASGPDVAPMRLPLFGYMITCLSHEVAVESGILVAITNLCRYEVRRLNIFNLVNVLQGEVSDVSNDNTEAEVALLSGLTLREMLLAIYDKMFPLSHE